MFRSLYTIFLILLFSSGSLYADTLGSTTLINNGTSGVGAPPYACYNSIDKQFFIGWVYGALYNAIYDMNGNKLIGRTLMVENGGTVIPFTLPGSCHNTQQNNYFISFLGLSSEYRPWFSILDHEGNPIIGPRSINTYAGDQAASLVFCCYNSHEDQYVVTWASQYNLAYFAIVNKDGNMVRPASGISGASIHSSEGHCSFVTYNSQDNEYLFSWQDRSSKMPRFAIYRSDGTLRVPGTTIESPVDASALVVSSCYNSDENQYLITWNTIDLRGFFAICNADGTIAKGATLFSDQVSSFNQGTVFCNYNTINKEYFLSWEGTDGNSKCAAFDTQGNVSLEPVNIPNVAGVYNYGFAASAYSPDRNALLTTWMGPIEMTKGYYSLFFRTPPYSPVAQPILGRGQRILNRFPAYSEYFNRLAWSPGNGGNPIGYHVYRAGILIATVGISQTLYEDHNQPNASVMYAIRAYDDVGQESAPLYIEIA